MKLKNIFLILLIFHTIMPIKLYGKVKKTTAPRITTQSKTSITAKSSTVVNNTKNLNVGQLQIQVSADAALEGVPVNFNGGGYSTSTALSSNNGSQISFAGSYTPATGTVTVASSSCKTLPGTINYPITINGNSSLEGIGNVANGLSLANPSTNLTINSSSAINSSINLNGGTSTLQSDLNFGSGNQFAGSGTITGNGNSTILGGSDLTITSTLIWANVDIVANSQLTLWGTWDLYGDVHVLGQGNIIDISHGGSLFIASGAQVTIADLTIRGLGSRGTIQFEDNTGQLTLASCTIELADDYTFDTGGIYVNGPTTVITADKILTFDTNASMTVDGVTLWYNPLTFNDNNNIEPTPTQDPNQKFIAYLNNGLISAVVNSSGIKNNSNAIIALSNTVRTDSNAFAYEIKNNSNAIIKLSQISPSGLLVQTSNAVVKLSRTSPVVSGNVNINVTLNETIILNSNQDINITNTAGVIINGNGQTIVFNNTSGPQFIIQDNVTVTLQNVTLYNINQNTFNIKSGGAVLIGPNTTFEFSENVTFSTGTFDVLSGSVFTLESAVGNEIVTFNDQATLNLGDNTLQLENVELGSIANISYGSANLVELGTEASVDVDVNNGLNFEAIGPENALTFMKDNLTLSGLITYGDAAINELDFRLVLPNGLDPARVAAGEIHPIVNLTGGPGIMLGGSPTNVSRLTLENSYIILNLINSDAFLFDQNGQLFFDTLEVRSNVIKQYSANVLYNGTTTVGPLPDSSFEIALATEQTQKQDSTSKLSSKPNTKIYLEQKAAKEKAAKDMVIQQAAKTQKSNTTTNAKVSVKPKIAPRDFKDKKLNNIIKNRKGIEDFNASLGIEPSQPDPSPNSSNDFETLRAVILPTKNVNTYQNTQFNVNSTPPTGNLLLTFGSQINNMFTELNGVPAPFNIVLEDGCSISMAPQDVILAPNTQIINIVGTGNIIEVSNTLTINNNLLLDQNAELTISFNQSGNVMPTVIFSAGSSINIEYNSVLKFEGTGIVKLEDGTIINLNGQKVTNSKTGETVSIQRAQLIISNGAILDFGENVNINGIGKIILQDRGYIKPSAASSLIIGSNNQADNDIDIEGIGNGGISLALPEGSTGQTSISLWNLTSNLNLSGGVLSIGNNGLFQISCSGSTLIPGNITEFSFNGRGNLFIQEGGILRMAPNKINNSTGWDYKLDWLGSEMSVSNNNGRNGIIDFVNFENKRYGSFTGIFNPSNIDLYKNYYASNKTDISFSKLASMLVNQNSILLVSTLYNNPDGNQFVRTKYGISVQLNSEDVIDSDDENTGNIFGHNEQENFVILPNGTRQ